MNKPATAPSISGAIVRGLLSSPPLDWLKFLLDLWRRLPPLFSRGRREGMYEILAYDSTLELLDPQGKTAVFKRRQKVKFLQDNVMAFQDYAWGDGDIFADYKC